MLDVPRPEARNSFIRMRSGEGSNQNLDLAIDLRYLDLNEARPEACRC